MLGLSGTGSCDAVGPKFEAPFFCLVGGLEHVLFFLILGIIIPHD